jgi:hypothetical protein
MGRAVGQSSFLTTNRTPRDDMDRSSFTLVRFVVKVFALPAACPLTPRAL